MGKPRMIILIRHAQSEGNKNRDIHQFIPDHRVKLTPHGITQAEEAGRQLRSLLKPDDTIQFFTSPYRRTRETTESILRTLTSDSPTPSPFPRHKIKVYEEPRLREQDFGNFQPCSAEMERMWQERADYGHFFYRIPDGESAADAYDRVSGFNESLWRQFGDQDFPSVCVLVTHGLMSRVFLMKWYHWSVEYFEDLRNVNHCEFIIMKRSEEGGKYILQNELRTWSELKRRAAAAGAVSVAPTASSRPTPVTAPAQNSSSSPTVPVRRWGGCVNGCNHDKWNWPRRQMRKNTADYLGTTPLSTTLESDDPQKSAHDDHPEPHENDHTHSHTPMIEEPSPAKLPRKHSVKTISLGQTNIPTPASPNDASNDASESSSDSHDEEAGPRPPSHVNLRTASLISNANTNANARHLHPPPRTPGEGFSDDSDYFPGMQHLHHHSHTRPPSRQRNLPRGPSTKSLSGRPVSKERGLVRKQSEIAWKVESGMGEGRRADALGDGEEEGSSEDEVVIKSKQGTVTRAGAAVGSGVRVKKRDVTPSDDDDDHDKKETYGDDEPILEEARKGNMMVAQTEGERGMNEHEKGEEERIREVGVEKAKEDEKRGFGEVY